MACQVPVVGSDSGEIPNVIGDGGLVVREADRADLRAALARLMADPGLRRELGLRGRGRVLERFTQASVAARTVEVYRQVMGQ
jgi:glycosyltransferase involved in cell wall biosynthesis